MQCRNSRRTEFDIDVTLLQVTMKGIKILTHSGKLRNYEILYIDVV